MNAEWTHVQKGKDRTGRTESRKVGEWEGRKERRKGRKEGGRKEKEVEREDGRVGMGWMEEGRDREDWTSPQSSSGPFSIL